MTTRHPPCRPGVLLSRSPPWRRVPAATTNPPTSAPVSAPTSPLAVVDSTGHDHDTITADHRTAPPTLAGPPVDVALGARIPDLVGYRTTVPEANSVLWPQFGLPDDVTVHAVNVEGDDEAAGTLVVVDGLDFDRHVNTLFDDEVELIIDAETTPGETWCC